MELVILITLSLTMSALLSVQLPIVLHALLQMSVKLAPLAIVFNHPAVSLIAPSPTVKPAHLLMSAKLVLLDLCFLTTYALSSVPTLTVRLALPPQSAPNVPQAILSTLALGLALSPALSQTVKLAQLPMSVKVVTQDFRFPITYAPSLVRFLTVRLAAEQTSAKLALKDSFYPAMLAIRFNVQSITVPPVSRIMYASLVMLDSL